MTPTQDSEQDSCPQAEGPAAVHPRRARVDHCRVGIHDRDPSPPYEHPLLNTRATELSPKTGAVRSAGATNSSSDVGSPSPPIRSLRVPAQAHTLGEYRGRGTGLTITCGIDWAENHHDIALVDEAGKLVSKRRIGDDAEGFHQLLAILTEAGDTPQNPIPVAVDTARGWLFASLRATERKVYSINPMALANILRTDSDVHRPLPADSEWKALVEVFPAARHQRCWVHKARNVTNALPKAAQSGATKAMQEIYNAEDRGHAEKAIEAFAKTYGAKFPKAVAKITDDRDELLAFYDFPAEHWIHLRTTNPIESTFSTVKLRTKVTRGAGSPAAALAMVFKLVESAQAHWRAITGAHLVPLVRTGARFESGVLVEGSRGAA